MKFRSRTSVSIYIAQRLLVRQHGNMDDPETWKQVAASFGHQVSYWTEPNGIVGEFLAAEAGSGVIWINTAYPPEIQARGFVHELAHAEMNVLASGLHAGEVPGFLAGEWQRAGYDDDPKDVRHQIAREVERLCFRRK